MYSILMIVMDRATLKHTWDMIEFSEHEGTLYVQFLQYVAHSIVFTQIL